MLSLYHEHYKVRYMPRGLTSWVFYAICLLTILIIPFIIGLAMQNFWVETNYFYQIPEVYFTGRCALRVTTVLGKEMLWTCSERFNERYLTGDPMAVLPYFAMYEDDKDANGKIDDITIILSVPINDLNSSLYSDVSDVPVGTQLDAVQSVVFLPEFVYRVSHYLIKVNMTAAPLLEYSRAQPYDTQGDASTSRSFSTGPLAASTDADMMFYTTESLINSPYVHYSHTYTASPFVEFARQPADLMDLRHFARHYTARNQSVVLRRYAEAVGSLALLQQEEVVRGLWEDLDALNAFTWRIHLRVQKAKMEYVPSYAEVLKWAWVQYFIIGYLIQWFLWWVRRFVVKLGLLDTTAIFHTMQTP